jgi:hypothetical protein
MSPKINLELVDGSVRCTVELPPEYIAEVFNGVAAASWAALGAIWGGARKDP